MNDHLMICFFFNCFEFNCHLEAAVKYQSGNDINRHFRCPHPHFPFNQLSCQVNVNKHFLTFLILLSTQDVLEASIKFLWTWVKDKHWEQSVLRNVCYSSGSCLTSFPIKNPFFIFYFCVWKHCVCSRNVVL